MKTLHVLLVKSTVLILLGSTDPRDEFFPLQKKYLIWYLQVNNLYRYQVMLQECSETTITFTMQGFYLLLVLKRTLGAQQTSLR